MHGYSDTNSSTLATQNVFVPKATGEDKMVRQCGANLDLQRNSE